jgi:formylglycine-generating enzyme required for sulfatase activity
MSGPNPMVSGPDLEAEWRVLAAGIPPHWASEWGQDRHGLFVGFSVGDSTQRLRWIPAGTFLMGSPEDEPGRFIDEVPQHRVTIRRGFWLGDTPCTQALWQAVTGSDPSRFKDPIRPVETVSWYEVQEFLVQLNDRVPGLAAALPSEAQWEYACRAGTDTATYAGALQILGENNAPALDPIAWYGGNSGRDFDLADGYDTSGWPEKQYSDARAGTRKVKRKRPNAWGLYDMLGNVWEWCADGRRDYGPRPVADPLGSLETGAGRALRGGSWDGGARSLRSACRDAGGRGLRDGNVGFRCARVQA